MDTRDRRDAARRVDPVVSFILLNGLGGLVVALLMVTAILLLDIGRIGTLVAASEIPVLATALLGAGFAVTFASLAMGSAIMRIGADHRSGPGSGRMVPVPVRARRDRRR